MKRPAALLLTALAAGCGRRAADRQQPPAWEQPRTVETAPGLFRLPHGDCLDARRLPSPWRRGLRDSGSAELVADAAALGVRQTAYDWWGRGGPGLVSVGYGGWTRPPPGQGNWPVAEPDRIRTLIRSGMLKGDTTPPLAGLRRFVGPGGTHDYFDQRLLTQCNESGNSTLCIAVAQRQDWSFGFQIDGGQGDKLPALLHRIEQVVEAGRRPCPDTVRRG